MMNTLFAKLFGTKETVTTITPSLEVSSQKHSELYDKYYQYYLKGGYNHEDADLIAHTFEESVVHADPTHISLAEMRTLGSLSTYVFHNGACIYCHDKNGKVLSQHHLPLEAAIVLHNTGEVFFERSSRHYLEYYNLV